MRVMTAEEIEETKGTEFKYVFEDGSHISAVIAAFDVGVGFTCLATSLESSDGADLSDMVDGNGNLCLVGLSPDMYDDTCEFLRVISFHLRSIRLLGYYVADSYTGFGYGGGIGIAICSF